MAPSSGWRWILLAAGLAVSALVFLDLCDWIFDCGCRAPWNGAAIACNVRDPATHDCPWCASGWLGSVLSFGPVALAQAAAALLPYRAPVLVRALLTLAALPLVGTASGLIFGWWTGYWVA